MSRHGECIDLPGITARKESLAGSSTPSEIEDKLKSAGIDYTIGPLPDTQEGIVKLDIPSENLSMLLVQKQFCKEFIDR